MPKKQVEENEEEVLNFERPDFKFVPKGNHEWRQQGPYIICKSCELQHGIWIGTEKRLVGLKENGEPILEDL